MSWSHPPAVAGGHPCAVLAICVRRRCLVVAGPAVQTAGLAGATGRAGAHRVDALVSDRDVLAGRFRRDRRIRDVRRPWAQLGNAQLAGWVAVAPPDGWTTADTERIRRALEKVEAVGA